MPILQQELEFAEILEVAEKLKKRDDVRGEVSETCLEDGGGLAVELDDAGEHMRVDSLVPLFVVESHRDSIRLVTGIQFVL